MAAVTIRRWSPGSREKEAWQKAGHNTGFQESRLDPLHRSAWKNPMRDLPGGKTGPENLADIHG